MFLYRQIAKGHDMVQIVQDFDTACEMARRFVGEHNEVDGCSTPREETSHGEVFRTYRSSSFGHRRATARPVFEDKLIGID